MKYVILHTAIGGVTRAHTLVFPERMMHATVAIGYQMGLRREERQNSFVFSAGFCYVNGDSEFVVEVVGSDSLHIERTNAPHIRDRDADMLNLHGTDGVVM